MSTKMKKLSLAALITFIAIVTLVFGGIMTQKLFAQGTTKVDEQSNPNCNGKSGHTLGSGPCESEDNTNECDQQ